MRRIDAYGYGVACEVSYDTAYFLLLRGFLFFCYSDALCNRVFAQITRVHYVDLIAIVQFAIDLSFTADYELNSKTVAGNGDAVIMHIADCTRER